MKRSLKRGLWTLLGIAAATAAVYAYAVWPTSTPRLAAESAAPSAALIAQGRYAAFAADCTACHTAPGGQAYAGGLPIASPLGTIYSSNITPDRDTGIGAYRLDDFDRAVRYGIARDGRTLYPAMPYPDYAKLSEQDVRALYAYFMHGVAPVTAANRPVAIPWPLSLRWPLAIWRKLFAPASAVAPIDPSRYADAAVARGAYLVQAPGHCGSCHTPRGYALQETALDERDPRFLAGGQVIDGWYAVNLRGNRPAGLGDWSAADIASILRDARNARYAIIGQPMNDVVVHSTQNLSDADRDAIAAYLKTLAPGPASGAHFTANPQTAKALAAGRENGRGGELYLDNCAACHRSSGLGETGVFPAIAGNSTVLAGDPASLIRLILAGSTLPATQHAPSDLGMPAFGWRMSDQEVAQLASFVRSSWGNAATAVSAAEVTKTRAALQSTSTDKAAPQTRDASRQSAMAGHAAGRSS